MMLGKCRWGGGQERAGKPRKVWQLQRCHPHAEGNLTFKKPEARPIRHSLRAETANNEPNKLPSSARIPPISALALVGFDSGGRDVNIKCEGIQGRDRAATGLRIHH